MQSSDWSNPQGLKRIASLLTCEAQDLREQRVRVNMVGGKTDRILHVSYSFRYFRGHFRFYDAQSDPSFSLLCRLPTPIRDRR